MCVYINSGVKNENVRKIRAKDECTSLAGRAHLKQSPISFFHSIIRFEMIRPRIVKKNILMWPVFFFCVSFLMEIFWIQHDCQLSSAVCFGRRKFAVSSPVIRRRQELSNKNKKKKRLRRRKSRFFFSAVARLSEGIKDRRCRFHIHKRIRIFVWTELVAGSMKTEHRCVRRSARSQVNANERASANDSRQRERDKERRTKNMTNVKLNFSSFVWLRCHMVLALGIPMRTSTTSAEHTK